MTGTIGRDLQQICARERAVIELGPLVAPGRLGRLAPFGAVLALAMPLVLFDADSDLALRAVLVVGTALTLLVGCLVPWGRLPRRAQGIFVLLPMGLVASLLQLSGGVHSQFRPLLLVPLFWLMLYETRRSLWLAMLLTAGFIVAGVADGSSLEAARRTIPVAVGLLLLPMISRIVAVHREALVTLAELSELDSLTGVLNRRGLDRRFHTMQAESVKGLGVLYLDVDDFKAVNDRLGHEAGDELLRLIGARLKAAARWDDVVARVGGDEFVVVVSGDRAMTDDVRDRVQRLTNEEPYWLYGELVVASVSIGLSYTESGPDHVHTLIRTADAGMFIAKAAASAAVSERRGT